MPKFEYLDNLYKDYKSPFMDLLNKYYTEGGYKWDGSDRYKSERRSIWYKVNNRQINLEEYNSIKHLYLEDLHKFKKGKLKSIYYDNDPDFWLDTRLDVLRREELSKIEKEKVTVSDSGIYDYKSTYDKGFLTYDKNKPLTPIIFATASIAIFLIAVFLFIGLMSLIFD